MTIFPLLLLTCLAPVQRHDVKASPFDELRWEESRPEVRLEQTWYSPVSIDELAVSDILELCESQWPGQMKKRFGEDLVEAIVLLGWEGDLQVTLDLVRLEDEKAVRLEGVEMTRDKRSAIAGKGDRRVGLPIRITADEALEEVAAFQQGLEQQFAYLDLVGLDLEDELDTIRAELSDPVQVHELGRSLHRLLVRFGDGHASVSVPISRADARDRKLPFLLVDSAQGVVALQPDRSSFLDDSAPVVRALDGRPLSEWMEVAQLDVVRGSPQLVRRRSLRGLRDFDALRRELGQETGKPLQLTLASLDGKRTLERSIELAQRRPDSRPWPDGTSRILEEEFAYLRLSEMDDETDELERLMRSFSETRGLIVDVRGNGGGSRALLIALAGYLIGPDQPALVANVAQYRLSPRFDQDHLEARYMHRAAWNGWSERQRAAFEALAPKFEPEWTPPGEFSEWHYLVLEHGGKEDSFFYDQAVAILCDAGCFSATDIFLGALELLPRVTLIGTASSGGSARSQAFRLPRTGIEVRCASMASFRPDGRLYDGRGIEVDLEVRPQAGDFLLGGDDAQLEAAIAFLREAR